MPELSEYHEPGILLVFSHPNSPRYLQDIHHWYNTEHGPARLKLGLDYFLNGYRYKTLDEDATWLAIYDMKRLSLATDPAYTTLREHRSEREQEVLKNKVTMLSRQFLKLILQTNETSDPARTVCCIVFEGRQDQTSSIAARYDKAICEPFRARLGCRRSRLFQQVDGPNNNEGRQFYVGIHDFESSSDVVEKAMQSSCQAAIQSIKDVTLDFKLTFFEFYHEFSADDYRPPNETSGGGRL